MGSNNSTLTTAKTIESLLTDEPISKEAKENIFSCIFSETDVEQVMPSHVIRIMRHYYTHNFALLLYWCITEISDMTEYRIATADNKTMILKTIKTEKVTESVTVNHNSNANIAALPASQQISQSTERTTAEKVNRSISDEQRKRFFNALQMLRRLLPFAFESGTTPVSSNECNPHSLTIQTNAQTVKGNEREQSATPADNTVVVHNTGNENRDNNNINEHVNAHNEHLSSSSSPAPAVNTNVNTTSPELQNASSHGPYSHLIPAQKTRTSATMNFAQRFFVQNERCDDDTQHSTFPLLPRYMYNHKEGSLNNSTTTTTTTTRSTRTPSAATSPTTAHLHFDETTNETEPISEEREAIPTSMGAHLM